MLRIQQVGADEDGLAVSRASGVGRGTLTSPSAPANSADRARRSAGMAAFHGMIHLQEASSGGEMYPECDIQHAPDLTAVAEVTVAVCLFLNDGRFDDLRSEQETDEGTPVSYQNCIPASLFLAGALNAVDPDGDWQAVSGRMFCDWHAFVTGNGGKMLADVSGDQFGLAAAILKPREAAPDYEITAPLTVHSKPVDGGDRSKLTRWAEEWRRTCASYRARAAGIIADGETPGPRFR